MDLTGKCFKKSSDIVDRLIDDEVVIVPVGGELSPQGTIYNLDAVGARIWGLLDGKKSVADIRDHLTETMEVSRERAEKDLLEFLKDLQSVGAIEEADENGQKP